MLTRISFHGFKSFADKVEVEFSNGITAVIGPNGCGKSNIFDGVRWVLGEQSAKSLRGGKMDDVIFSGSDSRKAQNMAEVSLYLDNSTGIFKRDEKEVVITRRATRGKGSEYFINNEPAKMKEVHELFLDTGVGSNSYSIIGQGQIEKILSTKLDERRAIFEEASGIVKLKQQKEQTEKHLGEVDTNLIRIEDILKEIEKQLKPLRDQSAKAKEYKELDDELRTIETQYLLHEYDNLFSKLKETKAVITELESKVEDNNNFLLENDEKLTTLKDEFQSKNDSTFEFQKSVSSSKEEINKLYSSIQLCNERIENSKKQIAILDDQLSEIEQKYSLSTEDYKEKQVLLEKLGLELKKINENIDKVNKDIVSLESQKINLNTEVEFSRNQSTQEFNELSKEKLELEQLVKKEEDSNKFLNSVSSKMEEAIKNKVESEFEFNEINEKFTALTSNLEKLMSDYNNFNNELSDLKTKQSTFTKDIQDKETNLIRSKNKLEALENSFENNDSFFEGVKSVLKLSKEGKINGVNGVVADLIKVNKSYEIAMETIMASTMQFVVTEDDSVAKEAVNYLKTNKLGKATFLPLNMASGSEFDKKELEKISKTEGISLAIDVVGYDNKFEKIISGIIGRSLIAENLDIAVDFIKTTKIRAKVSTLDGEVVQSGSISGGQNKNQKSSYFKKKTELEELISLVTELENDLNSLRINKENVDNRISVLIEETNSYNDKIEKLKSEIHKDQISFEEAKLNLENKKEKVLEIEVQEKEINLSLSSLRKNILNLQLSIEDKEKSYKKLTTDLSDNTKQLSEVEEKLDSLKNEKMNQTVEFNKLNDELKSVKEFLDDFNNGSDSIEDKINKLYSKKEIELKAIENATNDLNLFNENLSNVKPKQTEDENKLEDMIKENKSITDEIENLEVQIKTVRSEKETSEKELSNKKVYFSKKETEKNNIINRLSETYEITEDNIMDFERLETDLSSSKKEVERIKRKMNGLGNINHQAIEDCEALEERYSSEKVQFDDVNSAKKDLSELLKTVEDEMTTKFNDTFSNISEHFKKIFVDLFGGGKATLSLVDEKDPLNSAIEIIAQPPGKKPQSINLLSGGEKAFTAVALIFSIISAKPSPFVIFDEVDAPLDDANVVRYAKYTKEYSKKCQFILVTHRKQCMQMANSLLGITQKVPGVSIMFPYAVEDLDNIEDVS